ncbi:MAG: ATP-grasp domain-containing protein [Thiobacillus sp.]|uniref:ATP-grasp domain-containing protein n=1 Tax=Thiobacillus sp. TaxID=924 RepID=UPI002733DB09|nr:ATP-grasp domain-containing protein [Thiobacillus sp.]MDP3585145.1 ATP-grasp domain-containing protein [Thiobacillus sp.]
MPRLLLLLPAAGYANPDFIAAAARLGIELVACADYCHRLAPGWGLPPLMSVPFDQPAAALPQVLAALTQPVDAVLAVDDHGQALAAQLRVALNLPGNPPEAVATLTDKLRFRQLQQAIGLPHPAFAEIRDAGVNTAAVPDFPLVVKARRLNASRGVVRADDADQLARALKQVQRIRDRAQREREGLLVEAFIPGVEIALDGVLYGGALQVLAVFDKPDPLDGPYFEETLFITPSRLPQATQREFADAVARACVAAGVTEGAVHAEARINDAGVWLLEIAPRGIGGLCGRVLDATLGMDSAEIVLRHAIGLPLPMQANGIAAGVMMIPIPASGILRGVDGLAAARAVPHISGIEITAPTGQLVAPPPEGAGYLGFLFSRAATPAQAEAALRSAHAALAVHIQPLVDA